MKISFSVPEGWALWQVLTALAQVNRVEIDFTSFTKKELIVELPAFKVEDLTLEEAVDLIRKDYLT